MTSRALALGPVAVLAALSGCKTASGTLPTWDEPGGGDAVAVADDAGADDSAAGDAEAGGIEAGDPADEGEASAEGGASIAAADDGADVAAPASGDGGEADPAPAEAFALPGPVHGKIDKTCGKDPGVGERLKSFELATADGGKVTSGSYRGRVLVVNFWGTWCKPCLKELPEFDQLYRRYRKHGMTLLAIATDEDAAPVNAFKKKRHLAAKLAIGGEDYAGQYSSSQFPFTFVVDTKGVIKSSYRGYKPECMGKLEDDIRKELTKRAESRK